MGVYGVIQDLGFRDIMENQMDKIMEKTWKWKLFLLCMGIVEGDPKP